MKLRTVTGLTVGAVATAVAGNRLLRRRAGSLENPLPGVERTYRWRGMDVSYTVAGDPDARDLVLVHGIHAAGSSAEFEAVAERLAEDYRVIAVDLPGFGRSDRPPLVYSATLYEEFLREFVGDVADEPIVLASSLSGAFAAAAAAHPAADAVERLILVCPTADTGTERPWLRRLLRTPLLGTTAFNLLASKPALRYVFARDGYYDETSLDDEELAYAWRSAHQPGARFAPASFAAGTLDPDLDLATELAALDVPVTLVWGRDAGLIPLEEGRALADAADVELVVVDYTTLLPHAEHPDEFLAYLDGALAAVGGE